MSERWHAFECFACAKPDTTGLVFDVRVDEEESDELETARCPRCGKPCKVRGVWPATEGGYGSHSDWRWGDFRRLLALCKSRNVSASIADVARWWTRYSNMVECDWLGLPEDDETVFAILTQGMCDEVTQ